MKSKVRNAREWHARQMRDLRGWCDEARDEFEERAAIKEHDDSDKYPERYQAESSAFLEVLNRRKELGLPILKEKQNE